MTLPVLAVCFLVLIAAAYRGYGHVLARHFGVDDARVTPAHTCEDGVDYVPTPRFYLFGQHFSAIAAAGPIAGPILACQAFGWLPCLVWIGLGVVLIGAVHDFASLMLSVRHGGASVADIAKVHLGSKAGRALLGFIWIALMYVIVAFSDITAGSFVSGTEELAGNAKGFHAGGAVAAASVMYLCVSVLMGVVQRYFKWPLWLLTCVFVPAVFASAWLGTKVSYAWVYPKPVWAVCIVLYCCVGSVVPVWALLQPRGYLGGFVLYSALAAGFLGIFFGGYEIVQPAFKGFEVGGLTGSLAPFLCVTIACGACSGFHGLVCSGTTSKQVDKESHMHAVGYGAMLAEAVVAFVALATVMIASSEEVRGVSPGIVYGNSIGRFLTIVLGPGALQFATTFGAMAFSTFVFDTLDVATRLGRYIVQELLGWKTLLGAWTGTVATMAVPLYVLAYAKDNMWSKYWVLFGASNQLLAGLTLLTITVWLAKRGKALAYTLLPMVFVLGVTLWALGKIVWVNIHSAQGLGVEAINACAAFALIVLALYVGGTGMWHAFGAKKPVCNQ